ncbi:uncharacterized protein LOC107883083 [Acyrthosiphon pisum]|uniref:DUF4806 domain-containing protein n=1 Tax=Acyrthosiphon pisum TaxID=7029 RepID=A0A8R2H3J1_ACYPI|nr:uncharacterized protein LOC107883083 [Acyrthosiphon pisum]|eukprot:XP_016657972.1 PREDICTED: uncharacterized protein LOC107883083 [Acyrthosiphon pisum]
MVWNVVHFLEENSIEAVPSQWYNHTLKKCAWPKDRSKIKVFIEKQRQVNTYEFNLYAARISKGGENIETLIEARSKAKDAQFFSELSEDNHNIKKRKKKKKCISKVISSPESMSSAVTKHSSEDDDCPILNTSSDLFNSSDHSQSFMTTKPISSSTQKRTKTTEAVKFKNNHIRSNVSLPTELLAKTNELLVPEKNNLSCGADKLKEQNAQQMQNSMNTANINISEFADQVLSKMDYFYKRMYNFMAFSNTEFQNLTQGQEEIKKLINTANMITTEHSDDFEPYGYCWPISSFEELEEIENKLCDRDFKNKLISQLSRIGGKTAKEVIKKIMATIFSDAILNQYSYTGFKGKKPFNSLMVNRVIFETVRKDKRFFNITDNEIEQYLKQWISQAPFRGEYAKNRKLKNKLTCDVNNTNESMS